MRGPFVGQNHVHYLFEASFIRREQVILLAHVLVMWKVLQLCVVWSVVPANLQFIGRGKPIVAVTFEGLSVPLFRHPHGWFRL